MSDRVTAVGEQTSLHDRKVRAGQRMIIGLAGPAVDTDLRKLVAEIRPAGFVLFGRNIVEPAQVRELNRELASLVEPRNPAFLTVDQEGGRVQRMRDPATVWPSMRVVGRSGGLTREVSRALAIELQAMGFNLNFAPVADVDSNPKNPVIGDRSFGRDPKVVAEHVVAFIQAHQEAGLIACAKHFPGHGDTSVDSHLDLPRVEREDPDLRQLELVPFRAAVSAGVGSVMTSHVVYPAWDEDWPATLTPAVTRRLLREELGYDGVVFSDDMEMKAVAGRYSIEQQARRGTLASVDVFLCCKEPELQFTMFRELVQAQEEDTGHQREAIDSVARVHALRKRFFLTKRPQPDLSVLGSHEHLAIAAQVRDRGGA